MHQRACQASVSGRPDRMPHQNAWHRATGHNPCPVCRLAATHPRVTQGRSRMRSGSACSCCDNSGCRPGTGTRMTWGRGDACKSGTTGKPMHQSSHLLTVRIWQETGPAWHLRHRRQLLDRAASPVAGHTRADADVRSKSYRHWGGVCTSSRVILPERWKMDRLSAAERISGS